MSIRITIPKSDLAKGIPISNGWHEFEITAAFAKPTKAGDSINYVAVHKVLNDPNEREVEHIFSAKALGFMAPWIAALTNKTVQEVLDSITTGSLTFDFEATVGKKVMGKIEQSLFGSHITSKIIDFASIGKVPF